MEDQYRFEAFNDGSERLVGEQQTNKYNKFVEESDKQFQQLEDALGDLFLHNSTIDPVTLDVSSAEKTTFAELIKSENKTFGKITLIFATLNSECLLLREAAERFYAPLKLFGEGNGGQEIEDQARQVAAAMEGAGMDAEGSAGVGQAPEGDNQVQFGKLMPLLLELSNFVNRSYAVIKNIIRQLSALLQKRYASFRNITYSIMEHLGELLTCLITLDEIILSNGYLTQGLALYKRMVKAVKVDPKRYEAEEQNLWQLDKLLYTIKGQLFDGRIFQAALDQEFDAEGLVSVVQNKELKKEFYGQVKNLFEMQTSRIGNPEIETNQRRKFIGVSALYVFNIVLFKDFQSDKKFFKKLWETHKRIPLIHLYGDVCLVPTEFLRSNLGPVMAKAGTGFPDEKPFLREYLKNSMRDFSAKVKSLYVQVSTWMVRMESNLTNRADLDNILNTRIYLLSQGLHIANAISVHFKEFVGLHFFLEAGMKPAFIQPLCECIRLMVAIRLTFHRRSSMIAESISSMIQQIAGRLLRSFMPIKSRLESGKKFTDAKLDVVASINMAISMLKGAVGTRPRRIILKLAMHVVLQLEYLTKEEIEDITKQLEKLETIGELEILISEATNCDFFYWSRTLLPLYFGDVYNHPYQVHRLQYVLSALCDISREFKKLVHIPGSVMQKALNEEVMGAMVNQILNPLCRAVENELRLHAHAHLQVAERNPWKVNLPDLQRFFSIRPLRFFEKTIDITAYVSHYLDTMFYNYATVPSNTRTTYDEMRKLAEEKYHLHMTEVHLPGQALEQGLDVLEIMRHINVFVAKYNYNINNQMFIERTSDSKTLNTITIAHIANSIRTHGIGIMNTTVNFIYQYLKQKFAVFSGFLFDDHIKSRLFRDIKYFKENRDQLHNKYPFDRALQFNKEIRKLGITEENNIKLSYLDRFRILITEIGNAMGYIRMIRSGGFQYVSNAIKFVPDLRDINSFEEMATSAKLSAETCQASKNLDGSIDSLAKSFAEGTEYFRLLISVFAEEMRNPELQHLKNFHIIVPPLMINFVEHILLGKDKLTKRKVEGGFFTDDGFAIGVAYILKLLGQDKQWDSLHWFEEVHNVYGEMIKKEQMSAEKKKKEEQQTSILTVAKHKGYQMEYELLRFSFDGARIFFNDR
eukprot:TRINITY_DN3530_c0_g1_i1.p1 TRINITY_DN3530_c0_g1~~TRINITY_DN3530_c0_g1_i1.p1  ORF type:complete len:1148 (+),score=441.88 TRINITY_DN3530_c0_g1_i1:162-3605(+)